MVKLICDLNINLLGHNAGYMQYIVDNVKAKSGEELYFLFNKSAKDIIDLSNTGIDRSNFYFAERDFDEKTAFDKLKFSDWKVIQHYAALLKIDKLFIMELTRYEVQIGKSKVPYKISGIEFRPSHRIKASNNDPVTRLKAITKKYKKCFFESFLLRSKSLEDIYILNDSRGVAVLNKFYHTNVFKHVVDPIYDYNPLDKASIAQLPPVSQHKVVFIIFGAISWRKNIKNILNAFTLLNKDIHKDVCLLIIGKISGSIAQEFSTLIQNFTSVNPDIELHIVDEFVSNSYMEYYFSISHISLLVYANFYGSSGLLGRAAKHNVISLVPNVGLMAEICTEYKLGYLCDPNVPADIKDKMLIAYNDIKTNKRIAGKNFYTSHSPQAFLQALDF